MTEATNNDTAALMVRIAQLETLQEELKTLKAKVKNTPRLKVSQKGAISVYGLQRMPVTLYAGQWERIIELVKADVFSKFIDENAATLTRKAAPTPKASEQPAAMGMAAKSPKSKGKQPARDIFPEGN